MLLIMFRGTKISPEDVTGRSGDTHIYPAMESNLDLLPHPGLAIKQSN
jgi:hypothetical protein